MNNEGWEKVYDVYVSEKEQEGHTSIPKGFFNDAQNVYDNVRDTHKFNVSRVIRTILRVRVEKTVMSAIRNAGNTGLVDNTCFTRMEQELFDDVQSRVETYYEDVLGWMNEETTN